MYEKFFQEKYHFKKDFNCQFAHRPSKFFTSENIKQSRLKNIEILLVDDHRMMRESLRKFIDSHDDMIIIGEAADGKEAVKLARETFPDIILMDVNMPVMNGIEATRKITTELAQICVIGLSMNEQDAVMENMKSAGASAYLPKTEAFESLIKTIRTEASSY